jgi:glyoxylase-like metal-dependent hydrolase (beta-lactamase superfamily II)
MMQVLCQALGPVAANCYIVVDDGRALIIDPGASFKELKGILDALHAKLEAILLTHAHFDHIAGVDELVKEFNVDVYMNPAEFDFLANEKKNGAESFGMNCVCKAKPMPVKAGLQNIGGFEVRAIFLPGHSKGSTAYQIGNNLFSGDVLFQGSIGRTDLYSGSAAEMKKSLAFLKNLSPDLVVYPGHGPSTTLGQEFDYNPYFLYQW